MADAPVVQIGENSPEYVAYRLMRDIAAAEKKNLHGLNVNTTREWLIRTYCMCRVAVMQPGYPDAALEVGGAKPSQ